MTIHFVLLFLLSPFINADGFEISTSIVNVTSVPASDISEESSNIAIISSCRQGGGPSESMIRSYIQRNSYSPAVRPLQDATSSIEVQLSFYIEKINELIERSQTITITGYIGAVWTNEFFPWNDTQFACVDQILLPSHEAWLPDISLTNSGDLYSLMLTPGHKIQVFSTGQCMFFPASTFTTFCDLDLTFFPFDEQTCYLRFESWIYSIKEQRLDVGSPAIQKVHWAENEQWRTINLQAKRSNTTYENPLEVFDTVTFAITIERKVAYYLYNVILPSVIISFVELVIFLLPTVEIEKVPISFTCLLAYSVFQLMVTHDLPRTSTKTPMLSIYIVIQMGFIAFALVGQGLVFICVWKLERLMPLPPRLYSFAKAVGPIIGVTERKPGKQDKHDPSAHIGEAARTMHHHLAVEVNEAVSPFGSVRSSVGNNENIAIESVAVAFSNMAASANQELASNQQSASNQAQQANPKTSSSTRSSDAENRVLVRELLERLKKSRKSSLLRSQWLFISQVVDRIIAIVYLAAITSTPLIMFLVMPMTAKPSGNADFSANDNNSTSDT